MHTVFHLLVGFSGAAETHGLRQAGDTGLHVVASRICCKFRIKHVVVGKSVWAWTNQRHVTKQDIEQLWKFVNVPTPQPFAKFRQSHIVAGSLFERRIRALHNHGSEFVYGKFLLVEAVSPLLEKHGAGRIPFYCQGDTSKKRPENYK